MSQKLQRSTSEGSHPLEIDEDSFWVEHYPKLQRYCHFLAQNKWDGEDIAHETYLKALKYSNRQQKMSSALLNKIAYHHWIDMLRKRKHETMESNLENQFQTQQLDDPSNSVDLLLKQFTPKQAVIFMLKEAFQYQLKEIADILDTSEMAVKSNLHRAKKRLDNETWQSASIESYWIEEDRELLSELFNEALKTQDPTVLIKAVPSIKSIIEVPMPGSRNVRPIPTHTASSTLCMAA